MDIFISNQSMETCTVNIIWYNCSLRHTAVTVSETTWVYTHQLVIATMKYLKASVVFLQEVSEGKILPPNSYKLKVIIITAN